TDEQSLTLLRHRVLLQQQHAPSPPECGTGPLAGHTRASGLEVCSGDVEHVNLDLWRPWHREQGGP
ncbi:hypothetical protein NGM37_09445, partial [Streptomyces sp. TRM76130]|nr:hypothetical protein [Streptomyces sp. TRM76130]